MFARLGAARRRAHDKGWKNRALHESFCQAGLSSRGPCLRLTLLTRAYCHLCDEMRDALHPLITGRGVELIEIDVDAEPALEERFGDLVPVLIDGEPRGGRELCHHRLDRGAVRAALAARETPPGGIA